MEIPISEVYFCDCMEYMKTIPDKYFELAIVDPEYRDKNQPTVKMRKYSDMKNWSGKPKADYFKQLFRISKNQIIWGGNNFIDNLYNTNEIIFWYKHQPFKNYSDGELAWTSFNGVAKCFDYPYFGANGQDLDRIHPTQKPVNLYKWVLNNYANKNDKILDTHLGSQSSRIAAYDLGFDFYGCELYEEYFKSGCERFERHRRKREEVKEFGYAKTELSKINPLLFENG